MRNLPRFALVPLAALFSVLPVVALASSPAGADTASECEKAFSSGTAGQLVYTTNPPTRLAFTGQTVSVEAAWDPAAWDSLSSAVACVRLDDNIFDDALGTSQSAPVNGGAFGHSFTIPEDIAPGTRLCTRVRLAGDPAGEATEAVWISKMHCFEVDHDLEEAPPDDTTPPPTQPPVTTPTTVPSTSPATSQANPGDDTSAADAPPASTPVSSGGGDSPVGAPFDSADATSSGGPVAPVAGGPTTPEMLPELPATGYRSLGLVHLGEALLFTGLALLVLRGLSRRRRTTT